MVGGVVKRAACVHVAKDHGEGLRADGRECPGVDHDVRSLKIS